jgi:DUF1365 family protein
MVYMRHRRFLPKKHMYRHPSMNLYFDKQEESKTDELERIGYGQKVFDMKNFEHRENVLDIQIAV